MCGGEQQKVVTRSQEPIKGKKCSKFVLKAPGTAKSASKLGLQPLEQSKMLENSFRKLLKVQKCLKLLSYTLEGSKMLGKRSKDFGKGRNA